MHKSNKLAYANIEQFILDITLIQISYILSYFLSSKFTYLFGIRSYSWILLVFTPVWISIMTNMGMYNKTTFYYYDRVIRNILFSTLISAILVAALIFFIKDTMFSRLFFGIFIIVTFIILLITKFTFTHFSKKVFTQFTKSVIIVGVPSIAEIFEYYLAKTNVKLKIIGYISVSDNYNIEDKNLELGTLDDFEDIIKDKVVDEVIFALPQNYVRKIEDYALICEQMGITVCVALDLYDFKFSKTTLASFGTLPVLIFHSISLNKFQLFLKRSLDIAGSLVGILITALLSVILVPLIIFDSPGPIFFTQDRMGKNGRVFRLYKFRTMSQDAELLKDELAATNEVAGGFMFKMKNDPRITRIGKFLRATSLDELPQFLNVLKGDMSLVGTRPPTLDEVSHYKNHHLRRISIKPGLTGAWQVNGRSNILDFEEVVKLDTEYIDNWSIWLDLKIILKTILVVLKKTGAR